MNTLGWISVAIVCIVFLVFIVTVWMHDPDDTSCVCKPVKFCPQCGRRLSDPKPEILM